ncbi:hypothetical protein AB832_05225 [Flavobacteriaceae bacterium (ex Bugula neritina AB1)]|nr:hypothetical protein AB832_05225 [Flavobacteriaceae bacterium (ex Bugula neritina AB1)]
MATTVTVNSNYNGTVAGEIIGKAFKEADTLRLGLVNVLPDIDFKVSIRKIEYANGRQDYACGFTPQGAVTLSEVVLEPKKIKNEFEICKEDLRQIWSSATMGFSAHNDRMPTDVEEALLTEVLSDTAEATDSDIWSGDATNGGEFDGFIPLFEADANVIKANNGIVSAGAAITEVNVEAELKKVLAAVPTALRRKDLNVIVSPDVFQAYWFYLVSKGIANDGNTDEKRVGFGKYMLTEVNGLPDNTIVVYETRNLNFGTGLLADHNEIRIKDMDESDLSGQVRYKMVYTAGVQYVRPEEIVYYLSTTTPA